MSVPQVEHGIPLATLTTFRLGGPAERLVTAVTEQQVVETVTSADAEGRPLLVVGGGSNLIVSDEGFPGTVLRIATEDLQVRADADAVRVEAAAGVVWDDLVQHAIGLGVAGVECMSGIPGSVGATPIQNVGAYGQEVAETIESVRVYDRHQRELVDLPAAECGFRYRHSRFKDAPDRYVVLSVRFAFAPPAPGRPAAALVRYAELARALGVQPGDQVEPAVAREAVLRLRAGKGMVLDPADHDSWSAGSFFTNPILTVAEFEVFERRAAERLGPDAAPPRYPAGESMVKTSAAWLIERAGFPKGYGAGRPVTISTKHTLALTNRGSARTEDLLTLAREVRDGVRAAFGVELVNEPVLVGVKL